MLSSPLRGLRVLDLSRLLPGPYCTFLLAQAGAEVIKVESPLAGDYLRLAPDELGFAPVFDSLNAGKLSLALNFRAPQGRVLMLQLVKDADVFLEQFRPGAAERWGLGYEALRAINPRLVYCSLSGYGQAGPYRDRAGHDLNYITVGGLLSFNRAEAEAPPIPPTPIADMAGGMLAAVSILSALLGRERTGEGAYLDVALTDAVLSWVEPLAAAVAVNPALNARLPLGGGLPCYNVYATADDKFFTLAALEPHFWAAFCATLGREDFLPRAADPQLKPELESLFRTRTQAEWLEVFAGVETCLEPVSSLAESRQHPQVQQRRAALGLSDEQRAAPMGAHTRQILERLGVSETEMAALETAGVIKMA
jgi:crotonobetainyl-CoA:carnitine CoA-transferase CaiB-like acyl-CoA transferase